MLLNLRSLQDAHDHLEKRFEPSLFTPAAGETHRVVAPVHLSFDISRQEAGGYRVVGHLTTAIELTCSRCLEPFTMPVRAAFDLHYVPQADTAGDGEREVEEDDLATAYYTEDQIDLGQLISEQIQLSLPMKPLCRDDCKGLCPQCGTNLNAGTCDCSPAWEDPRLAPLKQFKK